MLTNDDLIHLTCTADLCESGIAHACRLATCNQLPGRADASRLRRTAARTAVELALRHALDQQQIPYQVLGNNPFTDPGQYDVVLGGHRCTLTSYMITRHQQVQTIQAAPHLLLGAQALIPIDLFTRDDHRPNDIHLFAFLLNDQSEDAARHRDWIHLLAEPWAQPRDWQPIEPLVMKSECGQPLSLQLGGLDGGRHFVTMNLELPPHERTPVPAANFHSLVYIRAAQRPEARVGIHSPRLDPVTIVLPQAWEDLRFTGGDIWLTGWLTHESYRSKAMVLKIGAKTFQFDSTRVRNLSVMVKDLNPCAPLFRRVRTWQAERTGTQSS